MNPLPHDYEAKLVYKIQNPSLIELQNGGMPSIAVPSMREDYQFIVQQPQIQAIPQQQYQFHNFVPVEVRSNAYAFDQSSTPKGMGRSSSFSYDYNNPQYERTLVYARPVASNNYAPQNPHPSFSNTAYMNPQYRSSPNVMNSIPVHSTQQIQQHIHQQQSPNQTQTPTQQGTQPPSPSQPNPSPGYEGNPADSSNSPIDQSNPPLTPTSQDKPFESSLLERLSPARKRASSDPSTTRSAKLKKKRSCARWTEEENKKLIEAYIKYEGKNWGAIAKAVGNKTSDQCNQHWWRVLNPEICKTPWITEEDQLLFDRVTEFGESSWKKVSQGLRGRTDLQCRHRWNQLKKLSKKPVTMGQSMDHVDESASGSLSNADLLRAFQSSNTGQTKSEGASPQMATVVQGSIPLKKEPMMPPGIFQEYYFQAPVGSYTQDNAYVTRESTIVAEGEVPQLVTYQPIHQIHPASQNQVVFQQYPTYPVYQQVQGPYFTEIPPFVDNHGGEEFFEPIVANQQEEVHTDMELLDSIIANQARDIRGDNIFEHQNQEQPNNNSYY